MLQDLRVALRALARTPTLTLLALITIGLGVGAATALWSVVHSVLLSPLAYEESERLVRVFASNPSQSVDRAGMAGGDFVDLANDARSFDHVGAFRWFGVAITEDDRPRELATIMVTPGLLELLGTPLIGRGFLEEEGIPGQDRVAVLSEALFEEEFGGDRGLIGNTVIFDGAPYQVVGVMPRDFVMPAPGIEVWLPWAFEKAGQGRRAHWWNVIARLDEGVALEEGQRELETFAARLEDQYPDTNAGWTALAVPLHETVVGNSRAALVALMLATLGVLLVGCANIANLLLLRGLGRQSEFGIRTALGAGRLRLIRQLLVESGVLALLGGLLGVGIAFSGLRLLIANAPEELPRAQEIALDAPVLLFSLLLTLAVGLLFGLVPALRQSSVEVAPGLASTRGRLGGGGRLRAGLVAAQLALSLVLLFGAGLLLRSFQNTLSVDPGFHPEERVAMQLFVYGDRYEDPAQQRSFLERLTEKLGAVPGVRRVGATSVLPLSDIGGGSAPFEIIGRAEPESEQIGMRIATPGFFSTMGIPLQAGRSLDERDRDGTAPVAVINSAAAERFWKDQSPIGERLRFEGALDAEPIEIVGVVGNVRGASLQRDPHPEIYLPFEQNVTGTMTVVVETEGPPDALVRTIEEQVWAVDPNQPIWRTVTLETLIEDDTASSRFLTSLITVFAGLALLIAAVGLYGVISFSVAQRTRELGLRKAIGATTRDLVGLVLRQGGVLIGGGIVLGIAIALVLGRSLEALVAPLLFETQPNDPLTLAVVAVALAALGLLACAVPSWRASRVDAVTALRDD